MLGGSRLWRQADFLKLWTGQTISVVGSQVTVLALPTIAILLLHATAAQVGLLASLERLAFPVLALFAGVWIDRVRRRPLMIAADAGRACRPAGGQHQAGSEPLRFVPVRTGTGRRVDSARGRSAGHAGRRVFVPGVRRHHCLDPAAGAFAT